MRVEGDKKCLHHSLKFDANLKLFFKNEVTIILYTSLTSSLSKGLSRSPRTS